MKREKLRRMLAVAMLDTLSGHALTMPNIKRYVTSDILSSYRIKRETRITDIDLQQAQLIAIHAVRGKPVNFRFARRGSAIANERADYILKTKLIDLLEIKQ